MARTRSIRIRESLDELEQLRQYYQGRPQARRILFLAFLKEDPKQTISEAARKADISDRRGRYWWDAYRDEGLQGLLERRVWKVEEKLEKTNGTSLVPLNTSSINEEFGGASSGKLLAFMAAISANAEVIVLKDWLAGLRSSLLDLLPDVDYAVINVRYGIDILSRSKKSHYHLSKQHFSPDGKVKEGATSSKHYATNIERLIDEGRQSGFPFEKYHFPPSGFDFYLGSGMRSKGQENEVDTYIGSLLLLRESHKSPISQETIDLIERLRMFFVYVFSDFVLRTNLSNPGGELFQHALDHVAGDIGLTWREQQILILEMEGRSYQEIADMLYVSLNTVQSHIRSVYRKAGVGKLSEFFAKYFTPRGYFTEESKKKNKE